MSYLLEEADAALHRYDGAVAVDRYVKAVAEGSSDRALAGLVRALWLCRRWDAARERLGVLAGHATVEAELARGVVALGQPDRAWWLGVDCGSALRDDEAAEAAFAAAIALDPANPEARAGHATALRMAGRLREAREELESLDEDLRGTALVQIELALCALDEHDFERAAEHARRGLKRDSLSVRAELVLLAIARHTDSGSAAVVEQAAKLVERCRVPSVVEMHGWALFDAAERMPLSREEKKQALTQALAVFTDAAPKQGVQPSVVSGRVAVLVEGGRAREALSDIERALADEPHSPRLHRRHAEILRTMAMRPQAYLVAYRRVLEADPRDLRARLALVDLLVERGQVDEARQIVTALRAELPGNSRVARAWTVLATPWRMPESGEIRTRVSRPWEDGRDKRGEVVDVLVGEVVENLSLQPAVADRIRHRLSLDNAVFRSAADEEQAYLQARDHHLVATRRERVNRFPRLAGYALGYAGLLIAILGVTGVARQLLDLFGGAIWWQASVFTTAGVALIAFALLRGTRRINDKMFVRCGIAVVAVTAIILSYLIVVRVDTLLGILAGPVWVLVLGGLFFSGAWLNRKFAALSAGVPQRAFDVWLESLYGNGILPIATEASSPDTTYRTSLPAHSRIVSDAAVELDTSATRELRRLLRQRSKGSFALAGPRGAGKSTLLERWCAGHFLREDDDRRTARHDLTVKVDAPVGYQSQEFLHHLFGQVCDAVERYAREHEEPVQLKTSRFWPRRQSPDQLDRVGAGQTVTAAQLVLLSVRERENIRHVQSRTSEGEWSVGVPPLAGTTLGAKRKVSVQRSDVPLNHPELVARFRDFLRTAAEVAATHKGKVLIGIDELDRISDGDDAQRFINELKAVFNVPNCFFLVSVSEDALADFELSAMGMRTVFDSAFDTIVRVDYLDFPMARTLLNRRIIDLPEQFAALAYVFSGGLARELARVAEEIGDERIKDRTLDAVTSYLVRRQLSRTTRAAMDRLSRAADRKAGAVLIPALEERPRHGLSGELLRAYAEQLATTGGRDEEPDAVASIRLDVTVMTTYLAVLLDVFDHTLTEHRMATGRIRGHGDFETLARVRRYLGANPYAALELLQAFAKAWDLPPLTVERPSGR